MPARNTTANPDELVEVVWAATRDKVKLPRKLLLNGSLRAKENYLRSSGQLPSEVELPEMEEPETIVQQVADDGRLSALEARLGAVEARPQAELPSDSALAAWSAQAARVSLTHQEMASLADQTVATCDAAAKGAEQRLSALDETQQAMISTVSESVAAGQEATAAAIQAFQQTSAEALADAEGAAVKAAEKVARSQADATARDIANQHWGCGITVCTEDPSKTDDESFGTRWFGRSLIEGDGVLQAGKSGVTIWRRAGGSWLKSSELSPKTELVNQQLSVLDNSSPTTTSINIIKSGGGGGGSGERLLTSSATRSTNVALADSSNWANTAQDPTSGMLLLEITAVDGPLASRRGYASISFVYEGTGSEVTEYALLGDLAGNYRMDITVNRGPAVVPPTITATIPAGKSATRLFLTVQPVGGTTGGTNNFLVSGVVCWTMKGSGRAVDNTTPTEQPAWTWQ